MNTPNNDLPVSIGEPATNAMLAANITTLKKAAELTDKELLALHGVGPKAVRILRKHIKETKTSVTGNDAMPDIKTVDDYINAQSPEVAERLRVIRALFRKVVPKTEESIRYNMPAFTVGGYHLYMSALKNHIGMYPMYGIPELDAEMQPFRGKGTKDALHFKHSSELPLDLIERIIKAKDKKS